MAESIAAKLVIQILANNAEFLKGIKSTQSQLNSFVGGVQKIAGAIGIAFSVQQVASFGLEVSKLAGQAEGVRNAFDRLPDSVALMDNLKDATKGTVSELELMKRAVQAQNFNISLGELPKLLEFATLRAQQTGESVDYLVDSIVKGIGRKSPLILDNLGISAIRLNEEFKKTGDFAGAVGNIVDEELSKMPGFIKTAATEAESLNASFGDFKVALGDVINQTGLLSNGNDSLAGSFKALTEILEKAGPALASWLRLVTIVPRTTLQVVNAISSLFDNALSGEQVERAIVELNKLREAAKLQGNQADVVKYTKAIAELASKYALVRDKSLEFKEAASTESETGTLQFLREQLQLLQKERETQTGSALAGTNQRIEALKEEIKTLEQLGIASANLGIIGKLEDRLKSLREELTRATSISQIIDIQLNISDAQEQIKGIQQFAELFKLQIPVEFTSEFDLSTEDLRRAFSGGSALDNFDFSSAIEEARAAFEEESKIADESVNLIVDKIISVREAAASNFLAVSDIISNAFQSAASGAQSGLQALANATLEVIDLFLKQALAAAIANAIKSGGPLPVGLALAGAAIGVVKGLFRREVGSARGGGGGSSSVGSVPQRFNPRSNESIRVEFGTAEFKFNGRELQTALKAQVVKNNTLGG